MQRLCVLNSFRKKSSFEHIQNTTILQVMNEIIINTRDVKKHQFRSFYKRFISMKEFSIIINLADRQCTAMVVNNTDKVLALAEPLCIQLEFNKRAFNFGGSTSSCAKCMSNFRHCTPLDSVFIHIYSNRRASSFSFSR